MSDQRKLVYILYCPMNNNIYSVYDDEELANSHKKLCERSGYPINIEKRLVMTKEIYNQYHSTDVGNMVNTKGE